MNLTSNVTECIFFILKKVKTAKLFTIKAVKNQKHGAMKEEKRSIYLK